MTDTCTRVARIRAGRGGDAVEHNAGVAGIRIIGDTGVVREQVSTLRQAVGIAENPRGRAGRTAIKSVAVIQTTVQVVVLAILDTNSMRTALPRTVKTPA